MVDKTLMKIPICAWNMRGFDIAIPYLRQLIAQFRIICVSEHWLFKNQHKRFDEIGGDVEYMCHSSNRAPAELYGCERGQGGVGIIWDKNLSGVTPIKDIDNDRFCAIRIQLQNGTVVNIFSVYLPPPGSKDDLSTTLDELSIALERRGGDSLNLVCGDCNGDMGCIPGGRSSKQPTKAGKLINEFCLRHHLWASNLSQQAKGPLHTHEGPTGISCIDYVLVPEMLIPGILQCGVVPDNVLNCSDHNPVYVECNFAMLPELSSKPCRQKSIRWSKIEPDTINVKYTRVVTEGVAKLLVKCTAMDPSPDTVDGMFDALITLLHKSATKLPRSCFKRHLKPYWCSELNILKKDKIRTYRAWVAADRPRDNDNTLRREYLSSKKAFNKRLYSLARDYENDSMRQVMESAELGNSDFWRAVKKQRGEDTSKIYAVQNTDGRIVHDLNEVLEVWRVHFSRLCTPTDNIDYDDEHFSVVNERIRGWLNLDDEGEFLQTPYTSKEVADAIKTLNKGKSPGIDGISAEYLKYGGENIPVLLSLLFEWIIRLEYIPRNFREGIQVPLHKGKNTPTTDPDNYRGITLLNTFSKIFEILVWTRLEEWWMARISPLQGAGRKGVSCLHTAMLLQETISSKLESGGRVFVTYFDVSKAFDSVWVNGLFFQLRNLGLVGKIWRLLYKIYVNFRCRVRVGGALSDWYDMTCGIHQGGYLSLVKYISFINSLVIELEESRMCCLVDNSHVSPVSYADDLATACLAKANVDTIMGIAYKHSCRWRYRFNARKSAVLVYGESVLQTKKLKHDRQYRIGKNKVYEKANYDHVGVKSCINGRFVDRTIEKVKKGRRAFYSASGIGIKGGGLNMTTCNLIFWTIIVPITLFGSELWVLGEQDLFEIDNFQKHIGRRMQRFHSKSPVQTSFRGLGWIRLETFIYAKKVLYLRTLLCMSDLSVYKRIMLHRLDKFTTEYEVARHNKHYSPLFDIFRVTEMFGMMNMCIRMARGTHWYSKQMWKQEVWRNAWYIDNEEWSFTTALFRDTYYINMTKSRTEHCLTWWLLSNQYPSKIRMCENMAKLVCRCSNLYSDNITLKGSNLSNRACINCDLFQEENIEHIVLHCPNNSDLRDRMMLDIAELEVRYNVVLTGSGVFLLCALGRQISDIDDCIMMEFWMITGNAISNMYVRTERTKPKTGVG